nr:hypothetical protein GCM10020185_00120 [Pseudomonas brassicacearum subsp. brassicacearum]
MRRPCEKNLYHQVKQTLEANPQLLSLYVVFESNAIDASDDHFTNRGELGSNETGRFAPYWVQRAGKMSVQVASEALISDTTPMLDGSPFNTWFNCPKKKILSLAFSIHISMRVQANGC